MGVNPPSLDQLRLESDALKLIPGRGAWNANAIGHDPGGWIGSLIVCTEINEHVGVASATRVGHRENEDGAANAVLALRTNLQEPEWSHAL